MNGDGVMDLVSGCFEGGLYLLEGLGKGEYAEQQPMLDKEGAWIRLGQYWDQEADEWTNVATSTFSKEHGISGVPVDWDADGDQDLLIGASSGGVFLRVNEGTAKKAAYAVQSVQIEAAGKQLKVPGGGAMVIVADWDKDGTWDVLAGGAGGEVVWYRNVGKPGAPVLAAAVTLVKPVPKDASESGPLRSGQRAQIDVCDCNGDGLPDLLVGDNQRVKPEAPELSEEQQQQLEELRAERNELREKYYAILEKAAEEGVERDAIFETYPEAEDLSDAMGNIQVQIDLLSPPTERHGWVWLYERKPVQQ